MRVGPCFNVGSFVSYFQNAAVPHFAERQRRFSQCLEVGQLYRFAHDFFPS